MPPSLDPIFQDNMVLQRGKTFTIWGQAKPGAPVRVQIEDQSGITSAGADGRWTVQFAPPPPGGPYTVVVESAARVELHNVLVGDVWLCSGQSNMAFALKGARHAKTDVPAADQPEIRAFRIEQAVSYSASRPVKGAWEVCSPQTAPGFSAVAYYFGRRLHDELHVPIGLVVSAIGGSPVESWLSAGALGAEGECAPQLAAMLALAAANAPEYGSLLMHWIDRHDAGLAVPGWMEPACSDRTWRAYAPGSSLATLGLPAPPGIVWLRRTIRLAQVDPQGTATLRLGQIEKMDTTWINGNWIGASSWSENPRVYRVPPGTLHPGDNLLAVRIVTRKSQNGFLEPPKALSLTLASGETIALRDGWRGQLSYAAGAGDDPPLDWENYPTMPTVLHAGMIRPLEPLSLAGSFGIRARQTPSVPSPTESFSPD